MAAGPVQYMSAATKVLVFRSRIAPCMSCGMELWPPSKHGADMTAVLTRAATLISRIHRDASHTAVFRIVLQQRRDAGRPWHYVG